MNNSDSNFSARSPSGLRSESTDVSNDVGTLSVQLSDYYFVGDGKAFDKHFFIISVSAENFKFTVERSYVDFVEFDRQLRKKFPESSINALPLDEVKTVKRCLMKDGAVSSDRKRTSLGSGILGGTRTSMAYTRESLGGAAADGGAVFAIPEDSREDIGSKRYVLDKYLQELLLKHEIVGSDELLRFLDEERRSLLASDEIEEPLNVHDVLLNNVTANKCVVHRSEEYQYHVPRGHLILWRFTTQYYDIGFSVEMNGAVKVPYTRCASHKAAVCGTLEVVEPSICVLKWDNSYAKLRTKQLTWSARVVSVEQYHTAKAQALDVQRERKRFEQQRFAVQRCAGALAAVQSGVVLHESSVLPDHAQEERLHIKVMETELRRLKAEVTTLLGDLKSTEGCIEDLQDQVRALEETKANLSGSWEFSAAQLEQAELEIEDCNHVIEELTAEIQDRDDELEQLDKLVVDLERGALVSEKSRRECFGECSKELRTAERDNIRREKKLRERQQEFTDVKAAIAQAASRGSGGGDSQAQQAHYREEKLCSLVEKLLSDLEKCGGDVDRKNGSLKTIAEHMHAAAAVQVPAGGAGSGGPAPSTAVLHEQH